MTLEPQFTPPLNHSSHYIDHIRNSEIERSEKRASASPSPAIFVFAEDEDVQKMVESKNYDMGMIEERFNNFLKRKNLKATKQIALRFVETERVYGNYSYQTRCTVPLFKPQDELKQINRNVASKHIANILQTLGKSAGASML